MPNPTSPTPLEVDGQSLTLEAVAQVARAGWPVALASTARKSMVHSYIPTSACMPASRTAPAYTASQLGLAC